MGIRIRLGLAAGMVVAALIGLYFSPDAIAFRTAGLPLRGPSFRRRVSSGGRSVRIGVTLLFCPQTACGSTIRR